jgi:RNA polymerase sigma-54 factor
MLKQSLQQKLLQKLSPQQIQLMKLLQVPTIELEQRIKEEIESNPALEEGKDEEEDEDYDEREQSEESDDSTEDFDLSDYMDEGDIPSYQLSVNNKGKDDEDKHIPFAAGTSFQDVLLGQIGLKKLSETQAIIAETIIGNLDDSGYLRRELDNIVNDLAFSQNVAVTREDIEQVLFIVQQLDPPGVGARDLKECLLLQLRRKNQKDTTVKLATELLEDHFDAFTKKHYDRIIKKMNITEEDLKEAVDDIIHLNPKPGSVMLETNRALNQIVPDFTISTFDEDLQLSLNGRNAPELKVSKTYQEMFKAYAESKKKDPKQKEALLFVKQKIDGAKWFIDAIMQRQQTLLVTMEAIMNYQREYFLTGDETKLRPMILKDIAEIVSMDISTISRVANSKYVQTPYGTFLLKSFFSESLSTDSGEEVSTREVKKILEDCVAAEDKRKPITDDRLAKILKEKGYNIARRTVAKYREQLSIPVARLRKEL